MNPNFPMLIFRFAGQDGLSALHPASLLNDPLVRGILRLSSPRSGGRSLCAVQTQHTQPLVPDTFVRRCPEVTKLPEPRNHELAGPDWSGALCARAGLRAQTRVEDGCAAADAAGSSNDPHVFPVPLGSSWTFWSPATRIFCHTICEVSDSMPDAHTRGTLYLVLSGYKHNRRGSATVLPIVLDARDAAHVRNCSCEIHRHGTRTCGYVLCVPPVELDLRGRWVRMVDMTSALLVRKARTLSGSAFLG